MRNPVTLAKEKFEQHKLVIGTVAGAVGGVTVGVLAMKYKMDRYPFSYREIDLDTTVEQLKAVLDSSGGRILFTDPLKNSHISVYTKDAVETLEAAT